MTLMLNPYPAPLDQAWLALWVDLHPESLLKRYLRPFERPPLVLPAVDKSRPVTRPPRAKRPPPQRQARPREDSATRARRQVDRDIARLQREPISDWAKTLVGDPRISDITLSDVIAGIDDYFSVFEQLRRVDPSAYAYFSRIGAPLILENTMVYEKIISGAPLILNAAGLPSYVGGFMVKSREEWRDSIINDKSSFFDFEYFEKPKNHGTCAPWGTTIFTHHMVCLDRHAFTKEELRKFPAGRGNWGVWWYLGVLPDGTIKALPHKMSRYQRLPGGDGVYHSGFMIPPGIVELGKNDPHRFVGLNFRVILAFIASAVSGLQVTVRQGRRSARFAIPIARAKDFFADRDSTGRRKAILHLRYQHERTLPDGRVITVGEHLSGQRQFSWRGYDITIGAAGLHFPSPEGFDVPIFIEGDPDAPINTADYEPDHLVPVARAAKRMSREVWAAKRNPIRRGQPTFTYAQAASLNELTGTPSDEPTAK